MCYSLYVCLLYILVNIFDGYSDQGWTTIIRMPSGAPDFLATSQVFCSKCSGLYHGRDPCLHPEERAQQAAMRRLQGACGVAEKRKLQREATKGAFSAARGMR